MPTQIITTDDLYEFKSELLGDIKNLLQVKNTISDQKYLKSSELMELLKISAGTLQTLRINGTIPYSKVGGIIFYKYSDIQNLIEVNKITH